LPQEQLAIPYAAASPMSVPKAAAAPAAAVMAPVLRPTWSLSGGGENISGSAGAMEAIYESSPISAAPKRRG